MTAYPPDVETAMITFFGSLREKDRRRYAAVEAAKLGPGGLAYLSRLLGIDSHTIRRGQDDLLQLPDVPPERVRKKGGVPPMLPSSKVFLTGGRPGEARQC